MVGSVPPLPAAQTIVGVALPVPDPWGTHIQRLRVGYGDEQARNIPTHITLLPPTRLGREGVHALADHLQSVARSHPPFQVILRGTGTFRPVSDVVYVQVAQGVSSCEQLERHVRSGPVERTLDFPYHPHVTLAHNLSQELLDRAFADLAGFSCTFEARTFQLYTHPGDEVWTPVMEFDLGG